MKFLAENIILIAVACIIGVLLGFMIRPAHAVDLPPNVVDKQAQDVRDAKAKAYWKGYVTPTYLYTPRSDFLLRHKMRVNQLRRQMDIPEIPY